MSDHACDCNADLRNHFISFHVVSYHVISYHIMFSYLIRADYICKCLCLTTCKWPKLASDKRTGGVLPIKWSRPSFKTRWAIEPKSKTAHSTPFFLNNSYKFSLHVTVCGSYFFAGNPHPPRPPLHHPPSHHSHLYQLLFSLSHLSRSSLSYFK